jgi:hypothetical protein
LEAGQFVQGIYYTVHKLMAGLLDVYVYCDNQQALAVAKKLAGWVGQRTTGQTVEHFARVWHPAIHVEYGGLNESLLSLYAITGDPEHLATARRFDDEALYRPLAKRRDELTGLHANTQIPKIMVNLFMASELTWPERGLCVRQETRFPEEEGTTLRIAAQQSVSMAVSIRVPYWATRGVSLKLNGQPLEIRATPGSYTELRRTWSDGDRLEIALPMTLHAHPMPDDRTLTAIMYGPLVLVGRLGTEGLSSAQLPAATPGPEGAPVAAPWFATSGDDLSSWIEPVPGRPLEFRTRGQRTDVTLVPFYKLFDERYAVYWNVYRQGSREHQARLAQEAALQKQLARTVDAVQIGDAASEQGHALAGERTQGGAGGGRHWRHAVAGGWFSFRLKVLPDRPMAVRCTYWGDDVPPRCFDILVDGQKIATQALNRNQPGEFFGVEYPIPTEFTRGKEHAIVRFAAHPDNLAGGVFGLSILKPEP